MKEEFEKEFNKLSEKDKREVNNLIRFMQEKKYHDKQYEELLNQYIEMARDFDKLQSNWDSLKEWLDRMIKRFIDIDNLDYVTFQLVRDKINELESDNNETDNM